MKKLIAMAALAAATLGFGAVHAGPPGPNGSNDWGLCNAWAHNSDQAKQHSKAMQGLQAAADQAHQSVADWCAKNGTKPGN